MQFEKKSRCSFFLVKSVQLFSIIVKMKTWNSIKFGETIKLIKPDPIWLERDGEVRYRINVATADRSGV